MEMYENQLETTGLAFLPQPWFSGKWPIWRLKSSSRPPFSTSMIMGGRVTTNWCRNSAIDIELLIHDLNMDHPTFIYFSSVKHHSSFVFLGIKMFFSPYDCFGLSSLNDIQPGFPKESGM